MDWNKLKDSANKWKEKATEIVKKGKEYAEKIETGSFETLKKSKFRLTDIASYAKLQEEKRFAIFCIRENDSFTRDFLLRLPSLFTKAWKESGSIRVIIEEGSEELRKTMEITEIPSVLVKMNGGEVQKITKAEEMKDFMKNFTFYQTTKSSTGTEGNETVRGVESATEGIKTTEGIEILQGSETVHGTKTIEGSETEIEAEQSS